MDEGVGPHAQQPRPRPGPDRLSPSEIDAIVSSVDEDLRARTRAFLDEQAHDAHSREAFLRYLMEASVGGYAATGLTEDVLRRLLPVSDTQRALGVDLCCGSGEVLTTLSRMGYQARGVDWNPLFVQRARDAGLDVVMARADVEFGDFAAQAGIERGSQDFVICTLALDRVAYPARLLENLFSILKEGGRFAVQTLLPVVAIDDGPVAEPLCYTAAENRVTAGGRRKPSFPSRKALKAWLD